MRGGHVGVPRTQQRQSPQRQRPGRPGCSRAQDCSVHDEDETAAPEKNDDAAAAAAIDRGRMLAPLSRCALPRPPPPLAALRDARDVQQPHARAATRRGAADTVVGRRRTRHATQTPDVVPRTPAFPVSHAAPPPVLQCAPPPSSARVNIEHFPLPGSPTGGARTALERWPTKPTPKGPGPRPRAQRPTPRAPRRQNALARLARSPPSSQLRTEGTPPPLLVRLRLLLLLLLLSLGACAGRVGSCGGTERPWPTRSNTPDVRVVRRALALALTSTETRRRRRRR